MNAERRRARVARGAAPTFLPPPQASAATIVSSGYAGRPNSGTSSPSSSTSAETRRLRTAFTILKTTNVAPNA